MQNSCFPCHLEDAGQRIEREEFGLIVSFVFIFVSNLIHICFILVSYLFHLEDAPMQVKEWRREEFGLIHSCCFQWEAGQHGRRRVADLFFSSSHIVFFFFFFILVFYFFYV